MKSMLSVLAFGLLIALTVPGMSEAADLGLITGSERGTYYQFGLNLQTLVKAHGIDLAVHTSRGSVENIYAVYQKPGVQMGIVQADVLAFVSRIQTDPILKRIASKTKMVFPLYNEEIHILGRREITDFDGLADRSDGKAAGPISRPACSSRRPRSRRRRWCRSTPMKPWPS